MPGALGLLGGTFDPLHIAHLRLGLEAREALGLAEVRLIPAGTPPLRALPQCAAVHRLAMVERALAGIPGFSVDPGEVLAAADNPAPSYTVATLERQRRQHGAQRPLVLLLGADAFAHFHTWHMWREILELAHLAVVSRPGSPLLPPLEADILVERHTDTAEAFRTVPAGLWMELPLPLMEVSSTRIRRLMRQGVSVRGLLPDAILDRLTPQDIQLLTHEDNPGKH